MSYLYTVKMYVNGVDRGDLSADDLDRNIYRQTKHAVYTFTVDEILEVEEESCE